MLWGIGTRSNTALSFMSGGNHSCGRCHQATDPSYTAFGFPIQRSYATPKSSLSSSWGWRQPNLSLICRAQRSEFRNTAKLVQTTRLYRLSVSQAHRLAVITFAQPGTAQTVHRFLWLVSLFGQPPPFSLFCFGQKKESNDYVLGLIRGNAMSMDTGSPVRCFYALELRKVRRAERTSWTGSSVRTGLPHARELLRRLPKTYHLYPLRERMPSS